MLSVHASFSLLSCCPAPSNRHPTASPFSLGADKKSIVQKTCTRRAWPCRASPRRLAYLYEAATLLIFQRSRRVACRNEIISSALIFPSRASPPFHREQPPRRFPLKTATHPLPSPPPSLPNSSPLPLLFFPTIPPPPPSIALVMSSFCAFFATRYIFPMREAIS